MKIKLAALTLLCVAMICSESNADLLGRMLGKSGCGEAAPTADACCERGINISIHIGLPGRLFNGCKTECEEQSDDCCGMNLDLRGRVSGLVSRIDSIGNNFFCCEEAPADDCDNGRIAVVRTIVARMPRPAQNLGCDETPDCDDPCKLNLLDRIRQIGNRCNDDCETEEAATEDQANNGTSVDPSLFMSFRG